MDALYKPVRGLGPVVVALVALLAGAINAAPAIAQTASTSSGQGYPAKAIRVIVPYPAGGTSDILTRLIGARLTESWGQQIIADNRTGAGGNIGAELTARAAPDGYTLMLTDIGNMVSNSILYSKIPFDFLKDFAPVTTVSYSPHLLAVHPSVPVKTTQQLVALAKARPGKLNFATSLGGMPHLAGLMFAQRTGVNWVYIPTKGGAQTTFAVATGDSDVMFLGILQTLPHVNTGKVKVIAASSEQRLPALPDTPTVAEMLPGFVTGSWQGIVAPARTPPDVVAKLYGEVTRILKLPDVIEVLVSQGTTPLATSPQDTGRWLASERERWVKVIKESGFKLE